jgi:hypothetical protein
MDDGHMFENSAEVGHQSPYGPTIHSPVMEPENHGLLNAREYNEALENLQESNQSHLEVFIHLIEVFV